MTCFFHNQSINKKNIIFLILSIFSINSITAYSETLKNRNIQLSNEQRDKLIWETHEIARITALQCHVSIPYNNFVKKWKSEIIASENKIINSLYNKNIKNIEGFLTEEDNVIAKKINNYYGKNICMLPNSINEETVNYPYDIADIANFDLNYNYLKNNIEYNN